MIIKNKHYKLVLNDKSGAIESLIKGDREFILPAQSSRGLFSLRFRNVVGSPTVISSLECSEFYLEREEKENDVFIKLFYKKLQGKQIDVIVELRCPFDSPDMFWRLSVKNNLDEFLEWIDFPLVVVPNDLKGTGGKGQIFWPATEGCLVQDIAMRENIPWVDYKEIEYPTAGWDGSYPGPSQMQFMAYLGENSGIYFAAHDRSHTVKDINYIREEEGIRLLFKMFPGAPLGNYRMDYDMVLSVFDGDWYSAADKYRSWILEDTTLMPPKFVDNKNVPKWLQESPVIITYPVRGVGHHDGPTEPNEYVPYNNALPYIEKYANAFDSKIMPLLMHWEGTAPWAPPYVWPPLGGEESLKDFAKNLHKDGHLLGVYCSGTAWTQKANTGSGKYEMTDEFEKQGLEKYMCRGPKDELSSKVCNSDGLRWGYDMCASTEWAKDVMAAEAVKMAQADIDYIQLFDQNLGGAAYLCYSKKHGHPPAPGPWQIKEMRALIDRVMDTLKENGRDKVVLGCESAAAEPYMKNLMLNDLRWCNHYQFGKAIPAYSYVFHEYVNNFMGNNVGVLEKIDEKKSPVNLLLRTAYSFAAGDLLTIMLKDKGEIHWAWCVKWDVEPPEQEPVITLIRNLNEWRKKEGKPFLCFGRMEKPYSLKGVKNVPIYLRTGFTLDCDSVFSSRWISPEGRDAQIVCNYLQEEQKITILMPEVEKVKIFYKADGSDVQIRDVENWELELVIPELSACMIEKC